MRRPKLARTHTITRKHKHTKNAYTKQSTVPQKHVRHIWVIYTLYMKQLYTYYFEEATRGVKFTNASQAQTVGQRNTCASHATQFSNAKNETERKYYSWTTRTRTKRQTTKMTWMWAKYRDIFLVSMWHDMNYLAELLGTRNSNSPLPQRTQHTSQSNSRQKSLCGIWMSLLIVFEA